MIKISNIISLFAITFALLSCDGNPAGDGPGFPSGTSGAELWQFFSGDIYLPDGANSDDAISGTFPCADGGEATVEHTMIGQSQDITVIYRDCRAPDFLIDREYDLVRNGNVTIQIEIINEDQGTLDFTQNISYGGEIGFSAQCDYSITLESDELHYAGDCFYVDSEDTEIPFSAEQMAAVL